MIKTQTPLRISLGGGGTDLPAYYEKFGGYVLAVGIDKYVTIDLQKAEDEKTVIYEGEQKEQVAEASLLNHDLTRAVLQFKNIEKGIKITSDSDVPAGTGLGSSGAYAVGLLSALHEFQGQPIAKPDLAEEACHVEIDLLKKPIGKQDQYMAAIGGFTLLEINKAGVVCPQPLAITKDAERSLCHNLMMFYTGTQRDADMILQEQSILVKQDVNRVTEAMHRIKDIGVEIKTAIETGNITDVGLLFDKHWKIKKTISQKMSNRRFDAIYDLAKKRGALGGKIGGAGGGGFFIFYVEKYHDDFIKDMEALNLEYMDFVIDKVGTRVIGR